MRTKYTFKAAEQHANETVTPTDVSRTLGVEGCRRWLLSVYLGVYLGVYDTHSYLWTRRAVLKFTQHPYRIRDCGICCKASDLATSRV
jgi:hypothetical protein